MKLSKSIIDKLEPRAEAYQVADDKLPGFAIRVWPSGKKSAAVRYTVDGQQRRLSLGDLGPAFTFAQARSLAIAKLAEAKQGRDPSREKRAAREAPTFAEVARRWLAEYAVPKCEESTAKRYGELVELHLIPELGDRKFTAVTFEDVEDAHAAIGKKPGRGGPARGTANRALLAASAIFNWGEERKLRPHGSNPARRIKKFKEAGAGHFYNGDEISRILAVLDDPETRFAASTLGALRLCLYQGCRTGEAGGLQWREVDLDRAQLVLAESKTGRSIRPMAPAAVRFLRSLPRVGPYVFPAADGGPTTSDTISGAWDSVRKLAELPAGTRAHDLRHTAGSMALESGMPLPLVSKMLGHASVVTTAKVYAHVLDNMTAAHMAKFDDAMSATLERGRAASRGQA